VTPRRHGHICAFLLSALATGCPGAEPRIGASAAERAKSDEAAQAALEALDAAPLSAIRLRTAGERLLESGRPARAHAHLLAARALLHDPPPSGDALDAAGVEVLNRAIAEAEKVHTLPGGAASGVHAPSRERTNRSREDAMRLYREKQYAKALERFEKLTCDDEPRLPRFVASCRLNLAFAASEEGKDADAVEHLWRAADADPARRGAALYRDVARLERRIAVSRQGGGDMAGCDAALRRAFRAAPEDPESLYLLSRRRDLRPGEREWYERRLARLHPDEKKAEFLAAAEEVRAAKDSATAGAIVDRFAAKNPQEGALTADLLSLVAERSRGEAAKDAASARARYDEAAKAAHESRSAFESGIQESSEPPPPPPEKTEPEAPSGPAGPGR
jgi:hypothetical protein